MANLINRFWDIRCAHIIEGIVSMDSRLITIGTRLEFSTWRKILDRESVELVPIIDMRLENGHYIAIESSESLKDKITSLVTDPIDIIGAEEGNIVSFKNVYGQSYLLYACKENCGPLWNIVQRKVDAKTY